MKKINYKSDKNILAWLIAIVIFGWQGAAMARSPLVNKHFDSAKEMLSYSLDSLKDGTQNIADSNYQLYEEIIIMQKEVDILKDQLRELNIQAGNFEDEEQVYAGFMTTKNKENEFYEKNYERIKYEFEEIDESVFHLNNQIKGKQETILEVKKVFKDYDNSIVELRRSIESMDQPKEMDPHVAELKNQRDLYFSELKNIQEQSEALRKEYAKPLSVVQEVKANNKKLKQQLSIAQDELRISMENEKNILQEIETAQNKKISIIDQAKLEIKDLKVKEKELEGILSKAKLKINQNDIFIQSEESEIGSLSRNLEIMRKENSSLKQKLSQMQVQ